MRSTGSPSGGGGHQYRPGDCGVLEQCERRLLYYSFRQRPTMSTTAFVCQRPTMSGKLQVTHVDARKVFVLKRLIHPKLPPNLQYHDRTEATNKQPV